MHQPIVNIALTAARAAGRVIEQAMVRADHLDIEIKGHNDFVTGACLPESWLTHSFERDLRAVRSLQQSALPLAW